MLARKIFYYLKQVSNSSLKQVELEKLQEELLADFIDNLEETEFYRMEQKERLEELPKLERDEVEQNFEDILTVDPDDVQKKYQTSGRSSEPLTSVFDQEAWDRSEANYYRALKHAGFSIFKKTDYYWYETFDEGLFNRFFLRKNRIDSSLSLQEQLEEINSSSSSYMYYFPSTLFSLAKYASSRNIDVESPEKIFTQGELLTPKMRSKIEEVFNSKIFDRYATAEFGTVAWECRENNYHISADNFIAEFEETGLPGKRLRITNITNHAMPLTRYSPGDIVKPGEKNCDCGSNLPVIDQILGRDENFVQNEESVLTPVELVDHLADIEELLWYQLVIKQENEIKLLYTPNKGFGEETVKLVKDRIEALNLEFGGLSETELPEGVRGKKPMIKNGR